MRYGRLARAGLVALVMNYSCKFEEQLDNIIRDKEIQEEDHKPVIFQENEAMPIAFRYTDLSKVKPQYQKAVLNLTRLYSVSENGLLRGTAVLINPTQVLTAYHVINSMTLEYIIQNEDGGLVGIRDWVQNIESDDVADIALINLNVKVMAHPSLQFYDKPIIERLPIALITYNEERVTIQEGEITYLYTENGRNKFVTNIAIIPGNSGGVYVDQREGKIVGVITHGSELFSFGPSIHTLSIKTRERVLTIDEEKRIEVYEQGKELEKRKALLSYEDFVRGDFYLNDTQKGVEICSQQNLDYLLEKSRCEYRYAFKTVKGIRKTEMVEEGKGRGIIELIFQDGRTYEKSWTFENPVDGTKDSFLTTVSGNW
ncbi:trypsin-like peptidase domain-containing protein [Candidatus Woesearchaeota archaeon]|nr:trypsin-like peptidase domain-containing protein [Candidatus Woesearchaeota archaeon]